MSGEDEFSPAWWEAQGCPETGRVLRELAELEEESRPPVLAGELVCPYCGVVGRALHVQGKTHIAAPAGHTVRGETGGYGDVPLVTVLRCPTGQDFTFGSAPMSGPDAALSLEK